MDLYQNQFHFEEISSYSPKGEAAIREAAVVLAANGQFHNDIGITNILRCGNRKGLLGRTDQTHHRMDPKHNGFHTTKYMDTNQVFI